MGMVIETLEILETSEWSQILRGQALTTKHQPSSCLPQHRGILIPSIGFMLYVC